MVATIKIAHCPAPFLKSSYQQSPYQPELLHHKKEDVKFFFGIFVTAQLQVLTAEDWAPGGTRSWIPTRLIGSVFSPVFFYHKKTKKYGVFS